jgi:hypothetical protein
MKREAAGSNLIPCGLDTVTVSTSCARRNPDMSSIIIVIQIGEIFIIKLGPVLLPHRENLFNQLREVREQGQS